ncbi:MAG: ATP-binding protein [Methanoregula sp.]|nr:ATP-binding protein [Methanoregula sp.]
MVLLVLCIVGIMAVNNYMYTKNNLERESYLLQVQTEQNIIEAMRLKNGVWNFYDKTLNNQMKEGLLLVLQEYNRTGSDPGRMDLAAVKTSLGKNYDIYIINESGVIIETTYAPELGQDFKRVLYFYEYLTKIRNSEGFFADHIVRDKLGEGMMRKFAYMPTPDHRYILELGFASDAFDELTFQLADEAKIEQIVSVNPYVLENFTIYNTMGRQINNNELPDKSVQAYLSEVIKNRRTLEVSDPENALTIRYLFVDLKFDEYGSDSSRIVELTYNKESIQAALFNLVLFHLLIGLITIGIGCAIAFVLSERVTRPIKQIVRDVNIIASGDLEHRIGSTQSTEFTILENSTNMMVDSLKLAVQYIKDGEILQKEMIDQLPVAVFMKSVKDGKYTFWNKTSERIFDLPASEVIGRTDHELFSQEVVSIINQEDKEACLNHIYITNKKIVNKYLGERILHLIVVPILDSKNNLKYILGICEDFTDETLNMKIGLLFSITRTDVLNQLSIIMTFLERAQLKMSREAMQTFFDKTVESVESIRNQMAFVRSLEEIGILSQKWQSVKKSFEDAVRLASFSNVDIRMEMDDIELYADPLLPWIFYNLLINSIRHGDHQLTKIRLYTKKSGENLTLIYEDNGSGIPDNEKEKLFEFGYDNGTGFGLFLTREILGYSGFTIIETGEHGKGERFEILIPKGKYRNPR